MRKGVGTIHSFRLCSFCCLVLKMRVRNHIWFLLLPFLLFLLYIPVISTLVRYFLLCCTVPCLVPLPLAIRSFELAKMLAFLHLMLLCNILAIFLLRQHLVVLLTCVLYIPCVLLLVFRALVTLGWSGCRILL